MTKWLITGLLILVNNDFGTFNWKKYKYSLLWLLGDKLVAALVWVVIGAQLAVSYWYYSKGTIVK